MTAFALSGRARCTVAGLVLALALATGACGGGDDDAGSTTTTTTSEASTTTTAPSETTTTTAPEPANLVEVTVAGGEVVGGVQRVRVPVGEEVTIRVVSDADDEVHVHGYDIEQPITAGQPSDITFIADLGGVWEVELHELDAPIVELEVS